MGYKQKHSCTQCILCSSPASSVGMGTGVRMNMRVNMCIHTLTDILATDLWAGSRTIEFKSAREHMSTQMITKDMRVATWSRDAKSVQPLKLKK